MVVVGLRGTKSDRSAIGTTIKAVMASGRVFYIHINPSVGFMPSSDRRAHFGLGPESRIDRIEIRRPNGILQRFEHPTVDQILKAIEPGADASPAK